MHWKKKWMENMQKGSHFACRLTTSKEGLEEVCEHHEDAELKVFESYYKQPSIWRWQLMIGHCV